MNRFDHGRCFKTFHDISGECDPHPLSTPMDREWCRELAEQNVVTKELATPKPNGDLSMCELPMSEARKVILSCLDEHNPDSMHSAMQKRAQWLKEIELGFVRPAWGVMQALETLKLPPACESD